MTRWVERGGEIATLSYGERKLEQQPQFRHASSHSSQYTATLNPGNAYAAVIFSTPVTNSDNDGILDAWKTGPRAWRFLCRPARLLRREDRNRGWDYRARNTAKKICSFSSITCAATCCKWRVRAGENLFPSPDPDGNDPLAMVQQALPADAESCSISKLETRWPKPPAPIVRGSFASSPGEPGVIGWKNSLEFSKVWPRNFDSCASGGDCTARFPYGQKDSYHYVLFGHSLAIPAWNSRYGSLTSITVNSGTTTIVTTDRGYGNQRMPKPHHDLRRTRRPKPQWRVQHRIVF